MESKLLEQAINHEKRIEEIEEEIKEINKCKEKLAEDIKLIEDVVNKLEELEDFVKNHETNQSGDSGEMGSKLLERVIKHEKKIFPAKLFYDYYNAVVPDGNQWKSKEPSNKKKDKLILN